MATNIRTASHTTGRSGVVIDGVDVLVKEFALRAAGTVPLVAAAAVARARQAADLMRSTAPIDEGDLVDSITADSRPTIDGSVVYADAGPDNHENPGGFVSRFVENGTVKMPPRPFAGPAADRVAPEFAADIERIVSWG